MAKGTMFDPHIKRRVLLLGVYAPYNKTKNVQGYYDEFLSLAKTNELSSEHTLFMKIRDIDSAYFITKGKLESVKAFCDEHAIEDVVISEILTSQQERNLSDYLGCEVSDRTQLILEIFQKAAHSAEGKTQVEIALLQHSKSRLAGKGIHMSQQEGHTGVRGGPGETAKEREVRHIDSLIFKLKKQLEQIDKNRATQRKRRLESGLPLICLIGYTNAGKSTILNTLTKSDVIAEDKLFATLDTTTRELYLDSEKVGLLSDTVGFIQNLPHKLIDAFKSTLSELQFADLLLHVVDSSDLNWQDQVQIVHELLKELNVSSEMLYVFNKIDKVADFKQLETQAERFVPHVFVQGNTKEGLEQLKAFLSDWNKRES